MDIVIYAKDITNITGKKERTARMITSQIRCKYNKKSGDFITIYEFCEHATSMKKESGNS
jgi:hypothetical protein